MDGNYYAQGTQQEGYYQQNPYGNPASPPLQHPVPQHPFPIPEASSPQPQYHQPHSPQGHPQQPPYQQAPAQPYGFDFNDLQGAQAIGVQFGRSAVMAGQDYVHRNLDRYVSVANLKFYFNVSNMYVVNKLRLLLFPFRHQTWSRQIKRSEENGQIEGYRPPREDINSPDLYIPVMSFVTYILLVGLTIGRRGDGQFTPDVLGRTASTALGLVFGEVLIMRLFCYLLGISGDVLLLDLVAYSGYKFVGVIVSMLFRFIQSSSVDWGVYIYTNIAFGFFLLRSLRYVVLPDANSPTTMVNMQRKRRVHFLFCVAALQFVSAWLLLNH
ncbi:Protein transport protein yif1 [Basidiobolus ranarum]|uniref:Protein YIF1 n=1 Tax=Basidiobolus ranarum TaxID=34480 RepID=A0ABR2W1B3_9FUNG